MKYLFQLSISVFLLMPVGCTTIAASNNSTVNGITTYGNTVITPRPDKDNKLQSGICYRGTLNWTGNAWKREIVYYYNSSYNPGPPPLDHIVRNYTDNIPPARYRGNYQYADDTSAQDFLCDTAEAYRKEREIDIATSSLAKTLTKNMPENMVIAIIDFTNTDGTLNYIGNFLAYEISELLISHQVDYPWCLGLLSGITNGWRNTLSIPENISAIETRI